MPPSDSGLDKVSDPNDQMGEVPSGLTAKNSCRTITKSFLQRHYPVILCTLLHLAPVVAFIALVVQQKNSPTGALYLKDNLVLSLFFNYFAPNTVIKVYHIALLYITQALAFKQILHTSQSLTSVHDKYAAWLGPTSAIIYLAKNYDIIFREQRKRKGNLSSFWGLLAIALYFIASTLLGTIAPTMVYVDRVDASAPPSLRLTDYLTTVSQDPRLISEAFPAVEMLRSTYDRWVGSDGLQRNLIYNLPRDLVTPTVATDGKQFVASCGSVGNITVLGYNSSQRTFRFSLPDTPNQILDFLPPYRKSIQFRTPQAADPGPSQSPTIFFATPITLEDGWATLAPTVALDPNVEGCETLASESCSSYAKLYVLGCNIDIVPTAASYFTQSFLPRVRYQDLGSIGSRQYDNGWTRPVPPNDTILSQVFSFPDLSPLSSRYSMYKVGNETNFKNYTLTMLEDRIMEYLGTEDPELDVLLLSDIQDSLERALAIVYWEASLAKIFESYDLSGATEDLVSDLQYAFIVDVFNVAAAIGLSFLMALLAFYCTVLPREENQTPNVKEVQSIGILQVAWLLGQQSHRQTLEQICQAPSPKEKALREKGKEVLLPDDEEGENEESVAPETP